MDRLFLSERPQEGSLSERMRRLLEQQKAGWPLLSGGYKSLERIEIRSFPFDHFRILIQHNPGRIASSSAKVDQRSIKERPCFLCANSLPSEQRGLLFEKEFMVLCNPFPIFPHHFTIVHRDHRPQQIDGFLSSMLHLAKEVSGAFTVIYNGPRCGASAPDHMHFQAGDRKFMPLEGELDWSHGRVLVDASSVRVLAEERNLRPCILLTSGDEAAMLESFGWCLGALGKMFPGDEEPMINLLCSYENGAWRLVVFPRSAHRPSFYFEEGERKLLISPAAVDLGGVCITPRKADFEKITADHLRTMFAEVMLTQEQFSLVKEHISTLAHAG